MATAKQWRHYRPSRLGMALSALAVVAIGAYFAVLHALDGRAEAYFTALRKSDPALYLSQLRDARGFPAFLEEYRILEGYDTFKPAAPSFLVGRWTMRNDPLRLTPGTAPAQCSDPVTFDYGIILMADTGEVSLRVSYAIEGQSVLFKAPGIDTFTIDLISFGAELDHIEFRPPGQAESVFAYQCGR
ncbi:MAG: hypothetical protein R3D85_07915 [Paracoccaceae bacterium]